jgi:hypothetical protein
MSLLLYNPKDKPYGKLSPLSDGTLAKIYTVLINDKELKNLILDFYKGKKINPEKTYNALLSYLYKMPFFNSSELEWDASLFYYHFTYFFYELNTKKFCIFIIYMDICLLIKLMDWYSYLII